MASPHPGLQRIGRYWHFNLSVNGQRSHGSTRCTDLATARKVLEQKRRALVEGQLGRPTRILTVRELVVEWLNINRATFSRVHLRTSECALRLWVLPVIGSLTGEGEEQEVIGAPLGETCRCAGGDVVRPHGVPGGLLRQGR